jgi:uncharacterized protein YbcV (DUF1398 family)
LIGFSHLEENDMSQDWRDIARAALDGAETGRLSFPEAVALLSQHGFDGYAVDFRRAASAYYTLDGQTLDLAAEPTRTPIAASFDAAIVREAIGEAQAQAPGYTYKGFREKVAAAGCAGYLVSLSGRRVLYWGRDGQTHTEYFPGARP